MPDAGARIDGVDSLQETLGDMERRWTRRKAVVYLVGTNVDYAPIIEFGSDPHVIPPGDSGVLRFTVGGSTVYTSDPVQHPGTEPYPFIRPALDRARNRLSQFASQSNSLEELVRRIAEFVEAEAKRILTDNGNVDTGNLRASIRYERIS